VIYFQLLSVLPKQSANFCRIWLFLTTLPLFLYTQKLQTAIISSKKCKNYMILIETLAETCSRQEENCINVTTFRG